MPPPEVKEFYCGTKLIITLDVVERHHMCTNEALDIDFSNVL